MVWRIAAIGALWTGTWWLLIGALTAAVIPGGWTTIAVAFLCAYVPLLVLLRRFGGVQPSAWTRLLVFRPFWYAQLAAPLMAIGGALLFVLGAPLGMALSAGRWAVAVIAMTLSAIAIAGYVGSRQLRVRRLDACFPGLPSGLDGLRIVQVSDLHVGPHTSTRFLARVAAAVREAEPELIAITGDQVDDYTGDVAYFNAAFASLRAPLGIFAVAGNHDVYAGWSAVRRGLVAGGFAVLVNEAVPLERGGQRFWLAGTGDPAGAGGPLGRDDSVAPDLARTCASIPPSEFAIALAHNPALWPELAKRGIHLTLSGHTHYGQLSLPRFEWSLASPFLEQAMGWHARGGSLLYINPGTNYWGLPLRLGAWPEVTVITLRQSGTLEFISS